MCLNVSKNGFLKNVGLLMLCCKGNVLIYGNLEEHLSALEEVVWAVTSCLTQVCLKVILGRCLMVMR